ncbi:MAG TPA: carboxypeptidase regulatory-like domain-containing protein [Bryobacteraceae bacterium]|nr:carboxypeptidase regulatory-like domain-containing protein [Bryobacteraceae bacterium]
MFTWVNSLLRVVVLALLAAVTAPAQVWISGRVLDENGVVVPGARVEVRSEDGRKAPPATSDKSGEFTVSLAEPGTYRIDAWREGFFRLTGSRAVLREGANQLTVTLNHLQEFAESVDVVYSPPAIDLAEPAEHKELNTVEILTVPYPAPHDLRNALPLFQGVVKDNAGELHVNGAESDQTNYTLDGFDISDPVTGRFEARLNIDSVRALDLQSSRFGADKGRGSAGSLNVETKMGDDRWRFGGTNFVPGVSMQDGFHVNKWTPRLEISGPLKRGRAWLHNGFDAFYDKDTIDGLPSGENRTRSLTTNNLTRFQVNLTPSNILTAGFMVNYFDARRAGLSFLDPLETTTNRHQKFLMTTIRDQMYFARGMLLDVGFADSRLTTLQVPRGERIYEITPYGNTGNFYVNMDRHSYRQQWTANVLLPTVEAGGSHQIRFGVDFERDSFRQETTRHEYRVLRTDLTIARQVTFTGNPYQQRRNFEGSHYVVDQWSPRKGLVIETGLRTDWDQVVRSVLWSPRISAAWAPSVAGDLKLSAGYGIFHDSLSLGILTRHQGQISYSTFFDPNGTEPRGPVPTAFFLNENELRVPRYRTLSFSVERKLPFDFYGRAGFTERKGSGGFTFVNETDPNGSAGYYYLRNWRKDRYRGLEFSLRRTFGRFEWSAGYTRSSARTDAVVDYSLENPIFGPQGPGPFPWDTPNRLLMWGWAPVPKRILPRWLAFVVRETDIAYLVEHRSGFPFSVVNEEGFMEGPPNSVRLPAYFSINLHFERKFRALHYLWAWRFGFNNLTNNGNPNTVNNNIDSPTYLTYGRGQSRAFTVRLRFLGKK